MTTLTDLISMTDWDVIEDGGNWYARIGDHGYIYVMKATAPETLAIDATLEFLDKLRTRSFPRNITHPAQIMKFCVSAARRQR